MKPKELTKWLADIPGTAEIIAVVIAPADQSDRHKGQIVYVKDNKTVVVSYD